MKKFLFLTLFSAIIGASAFAQNSSGLTSGKEAPDAATMLKQTKEKIAPQMVEKTGLTTAQAEKVIEILFEMRQAAGALQNLSDEERSAKLTELKAAKDKKMSELLTADQIAAVKTFYEEMGKNSERRVRN